MNKKNILMFLFMMLPAFLLTSCLKDQEDKFDQSATKRLTEYLANARKTLTSAENGWVLNYFPDREQSYGGYNYVVKFDDENVTAYCELASDITQSVTSTYTLNNESGPCILFDTYNDFLHFFTTPSGSSGAGGYEAYDGDHMLMIMNISEDGNTITLKGTRSGNTMYMHRLTEDPVAYLTKIVNSDLIYSSFKSTTDSENVSLTLNTGSRQMTILNAQTEESVSMSYIVTPEGLELYQPVTFDDVEFSKMSFDSETLLLTSVSEKALSFKAAIPNINEDLVSGETDWYFSINNLCESLVPQWETAAANLKGEGESLDYMVLEGNVLYMSSSGYAMAFQYESELIGEDQVKLTCVGYGGNATQQGNAQWYVKNIAGFTNFFAFLDGTFNLKYDDKKRGSIRFTSTTDSGLTFVVTKTAVSPY